jgi:hypothetical protein
LLLRSALQFLGVLIRYTNRLWHSPTYNWWRLPLKGLGWLGIRMRPSGKSQPLAGSNHLKMSDLRQ